MKKRLIRLVLVVVIAQIAAFSAEYIYNDYTGSFVEPAIIDSYFLRRGPIEPSNEVVLIRIDEESYSTLEFNPAKTFPHSAYVDLLKILAKYQVKGVLFDISLSVREEDKKVDEKLAEAIKGVKTILPITRGSGTASNPVVVPLQIFRKAAAGEALSDLVGVQEPVVRTFPQIDGTYLGLAAAELSGVPIIKPKPHDYINFYGRRKITSFPLSRVIQDPSLESQLQNKIIIIGYTRALVSMEDVALDSFKTPVGTLPGAEIHATIATNIIEGRWIRRLSEENEAKTLFYIVFYLSIAILLLNPIASFTLSLAFYFAADWFGYYAFLDGFYLPGLGTAARVLAVVLATKIVWDFRRIAVAFRNGMQVMRRVMGTRLAEKAIANPECLHSPEEANAVEDVMITLLAEPALSSDKVVWPQTGETFAEWYKIDKELGRGAFGVVYRVTDLRNSQTRALKAMRFGVEVPGQPKDNATRFVREIKLLQDLATINSPYVIKIFDHDSINGLIYYVMEYLEGQNLHDILEDGALEPKEAAIAIWQICEGLAAIHEKGIIHRDLKSDNIMISDGVAKICDFGISTSMNARIIVKNERIGSPIIIAPEIWRGEGASISTDIYALGVLFFELLTRRYPFEGLTPEDIMMLHLNTPPPVPKRIVKSIPDWMNSLILRMLSKDSSGRPQSVREIIEELGANTEN